MNYKVILTSCLLLVGCGIPYQTPQERVTAWQDCLAEHVGVWRTSKDVSGDTERLCGHVASKVPYMPDYGYMPNLSGGVDL